MKISVSIACIAVVIACATPSFAQRSSQSTAIGRECYKLAVSRGERPGRPHYVQFMRQCKAGRIPFRD